MYQDKNAEPVINIDQPQVHPLVKNMREERQQQLQNLTASLKQLQKTDIKRSKARATKNLIGLLLAHSARSKRSNTPKINIKLQCLSPNGNPAIKMHIGI